MLSEYLAYALQASLKVNRFKGVVKGFSGLLRLWKYAFMHSEADVVIAVQRMAIPCILKSFFVRNKVVVVFHHYDKKEERSIFYHLNAWLLFRVLSAAPSFVRIVVVADFWRKFLEERGVPSSIIALVPNLFDEEKYLPYKSLPKQDKKIYFGQYSAKQHPDVYKLIEQLDKDGYECFFTTPSVNKTRVDTSAEILNLPFDKYLENIATSACTVCLSNFDEGWNRVAHESLLCGTPVIGNKSGGLGNLLEQAGQLVVNDSQEAYNMIINKGYKKINSAFFSGYHINQISYYAQPIVVFCKG